MRLGKYSLNEKQDGKHLRLCSGFPDICERFNTGTNYKYFPEPAKTEELRCEQMKIGLSYFFMNMAIEISF